MAVSDADLARAVAVDTGRMLVDVRARGASGKEGDQQAHEFIVARLGEARPDDVVLSEEGKDDRRRLSRSRVWIVDPIDGTREFAEAGRIDWAVHIALWEAGELVAGAVALPAEGLVFSSADPPVVPPHPKGERQRVVVSRTRPPAVANEVAAALDLDLVPHGSAGAKAMEVVRGRASAYVHAGGQYEWDSAAPVAVARAAGLHTSRIDGSPLVYNRPDLVVADFVICRPELAGPILEAIN